MGIIFNDIKKDLPVKQLHHLFFMGRLGRLRVHSRGEYVEKLQHSLR